MNAITTTEFDAVVEIIFNDAEMLPLTEEELDGMNFDFTIEAKESTAAAIASLAYGISIPSAYAGINHLRQAGHTDLVTAAREAGQYFWNFFE